MVDSARKPKGLTNADIFVIAVWKAGGDVHFIDVEDAYSVCWELTPQRFCWRTRKDLPNTKILNKALSDLTRRSDKFVVKQGFFKVRLSQTGIAWIETNEPVITSLVSAESEQSMLSSNRASRQLIRFKKSAFFKRWAETSELFLERWELAAALRCSLNSSVETWRTRIEALKADAQHFNDQDALRFLNLTLEEKSDWFEGD